MSWTLFRGRGAAVVGAIALAAAACAPSTNPAPKPAGPVPESSPAAQGQALLAQKSCGGCHAIPGVQGATGGIGPSLAGVASRSRIAGNAVPNNGPDDLKRWILDPRAAKPGTAMPKTDLNDDEASKIVAYLQTLR
jgi:cytochrome c1